MEKEKEKKKISRQERRKVYKFTWQEIDKLKQDSYRKGFKDGSKAGQDADFKILLLQVLDRTKGVGRVLGDRVLKTYKEMV